MSDAQTLAVYAAKSEDYAQRMVAYAQEYRLIHAFIEACPTAGRVLDLGCGPGVYSMLMAEAGLSVDAIDAAPEMLALIPSRPGLTPKRATFEEISGQDVYDGIWAHFSLLHAPHADLPRHLAALKKALKPGGPFFIGMKTGTGSKRDGLGRLYAYFSPQELDALLVEAGFTLRAHWTGVGRGLDEVSHSWIVIHADG